MPQFDYKPRFDERSRNYPIRALIPTRPVRKDKVWALGPILDQGQEGACVGHGWTDEATATPVPVKLHDAQAFAFALYDLAKTLDEYPGTNYDGTSVLAGAKAMAKKGLLKEYRWAFNADDVVDAILLHGPVVIGVNWYDGMFDPDVHGYLRPTGKLEGGHCVALVGYRAKDNAVKVQNSWGPSWGDHGTAWLLVSDLAKLLADQGEACVPVRRSYGPGNL